MSVSFVAENWSCNFSCKQVIKDVWKFNFKPFVSICFGAFVLANQVTWLGWALAVPLTETHCQHIFKDIVISRKFVHHGQIISQ